MFIREKTLLFQGSRGGPNVFQGGPTFFQGGSKSWGQSSTVVFTYYLLNCYDSVALTPRNANFYRNPYNFVIFSRGS